MRTKTGGYGFTIVEMMIVVAVIGLLLALAIPNFVKSRDNAQLVAVYNNLRMIETAKDQWAIENKKGTGAVADLYCISDYLKGGTIKPVVSESYEVNVIGSPAYAMHTVRLGTYLSSDPITVP
jgi:prepilin-type N-terminal cleavage/methylation domain-containing protein